MTKLFNTREHIGQMGAAALSILRTLLSTLNCRMTSGEGEAKDERGLGTGWEGIGREVCLSERKPN